MAEQVDAADLNSAGDFHHAGSSPALRTKINIKDKMRDNDMRCEKCNQESTALSGVDVFCGGGIGWTTMFLCDKCYKEREQRKAEESEFVKHKKLELSYEDRKLDAIRKFSIGNSHNESLTTAFARLLNLRRGFKLIGSAAVNYHAGFPAAPVNDIDIIEADPFFPTDDALQIVFLPDRTPHTIAGIRVDVHKKNRYNNAIEMCRAIANLDEDEFVANPYFLIIVMLITNKDYTKHVGALLKIVDFDKLKSIIKDDYLMKRLKLISQATLPY